MTEEEIKRFNNKCPYEQGIFIEPYGIPTHIKEPVLYLRYETGGVSGGSCWDDSNPQPYTKFYIPPWKALDLLLEKKCPDISYFQYKAIDNLIHSNEETEYEYYGNSTDWMVKYIILSELEKYLDSIKK